MDIKLLNILKDWLATYHSFYSVNDVAIDINTGYLLCLKRRDEPPYPGYYTLSINGVHYGYRDLKTGRFVSPFKFAKELLDTKSLISMSYDEWKKWQKAPKGEQVEYLFNKRLKMNKEKYGTWSEVCRQTHFQNCGMCERVECCDSLKT